MKWHTLKDLVNNLDLKGKKNLGVLQKQDHRSQIDSDFRPKVKQHNRTVWIEKTRKTEIKLETEQNYLTETH